MQSRKDAISGVSFKHLDLFTVSFLLADKWVSPGLRSFIYKMMEPNSVNTHGVYKALAKCFTFILTFHFYHSPVCYTYYLHFTGDF